MKDDIVTRLRGITNGTSWANYLFAVQDAADEIERLREELTASHESHGNEVGSLTERLSLAIHERDEARREVCAYVSGHYSKDVVTLDRDEAIAEAKRRGWDCFKENTNDR